MTTVQYYVSTHMPSISACSSLRQTLMLYHSIRLHTQLWYFSLVQGSAGPVLFLQYNQYTPPRATIAFLFGQASARLVLSHYHSILHKQWAFWAPSARLVQYGVVPKGLLTFLGSLYKVVAKTTSGTLVYRFERQNRQKKKSSFEKALCPRLRV